MAGRLLEASALTRIPSYRYFDVNTLAAVVNSRVIRRSGRGRGRTRTDLGARVHCHHSYILLGRKLSARF